MVPHSSTLAWKIPWAEEPGRLQSMGSRRVGHDWATSVSLSCIGEGNGNPLQCSCLENPRDGGAWWAAVYGVAQSWTWLKWLSSSSNRWNNSPCSSGSNNNRAGLGSKGRFLFLFFSLLYKLSYGLSIKTSNKIFCQISKGLVWIEFANVLFPINVFSLLFCSKTTFE